MGEGRLRLQRSAEKEAQALQVEQALQAARLQHVEQRSQAKFAVSRLRMLDPTVRTFNAVRLALAWASASATYFYFGNSLLQTLMVFVGTSLFMRLALAVFQRHSRLASDR